MNMISNFEEFISIARQKGKKRIVIAAAEDEPVLKAIKTGIESELIIPILVGNSLKINEISNNIGLSLSDIEIIHEENPAKAAVIAVQCIIEGKADILMKGLVATAPLLKAVLNKESGIKKSALLSHLAFFQSPYYHKILGITDAAMNITPSLEDKVNILRNAIGIFHKIGIELPKIAILCPLETVNEKIDSTMHAAVISTMNKRGQIDGCLIDGPLALDNAISKEAALHKGIKSDVSGDVDLLLAHDLNSGNALYKALIFLGGAKTAAVVVGAKVPIVLTSRADSEDSKLHSIALANILT
jgi:phosphate butyryltransferase